MANNVVSILVVIGACLEINKTKMLVFSWEPDVKYFNKFAEHTEVMTGISEWYPVRSKLYCTAVCLSVSSCTGFQVRRDVQDGSNKDKYGCQVIQHNVHIFPKISTSGVTIYVRKEHAPQVAPVTTVPPTTSITQSTSSVIDTTTVATTITTTEITTTIATTEATTTIATTEATSTIATTKATTSTTTETTVPNPCNVDAACTILDKILLFSGQTVYFYHDTNSITSGPYQLKSITSYLSMWTSGDIVQAAYTNSVSAHFITGSQVQIYRVSDMNYESTQTVSQHFSLLKTIPSTIDAVIVYNGILCVISSDNVHTSSKTVALSTQTAHNPFRLSTKSSAPVGVTATTYTASGAVSFAGSKLYTFTPNTQGPKGSWTYVGDALC